MYSGQNKDTLLKHKTPVVSIYLKIIEDFKISTVSHFPSNIITRLQHGCEHLKEIVDNLLASHSPFSCTEENLHFCCRRTRIFQVTETHSADFWPRSLIAYGTGTAFLHK